MTIASRYANAFTEVYEILQYLDKDEYKDYLSTEEQKQKIKKWQLEDLKRIKTVF